MKITIALVLGLAIASGTLAAQDNGQYQPRDGQYQAQSGEPDSQNSGGHPTLQRRSRPHDRSEYDPAAKPGTPNESGIARGLKSINRNDVNYGGILSVWRIALIEETIENAYWWAIVAISGALLLSLAYIYYLLRQRDFRHAVCSDVLAQVTNGYMDARARVYTLTRQYNDLVDAEAIKIENQKDAQATAATPSTSAPSGALAALADLQKQRALPTTDEAPVSSAPAPPSAAGPQDNLSNVVWDDIKPAVSSPLMVVSAAMRSQSRTDADTEDTASESAPIVPAVTPKPREVDQTVRPQAAPDADPQTISGASGQVDQVKQLKELLAQRDAQLAAKDEKIANLRLAKNQILERLQNAQAQGKEA